MLETHWGSGLGYRLFKDACSELQRDGLPAGNRGLCFFPFGESGDLMKNLFDAAVVTEVKTRLKHLTPHSARLWGKMMAPQMLAHCSVSLQWAVGEVVPEKGSASACLMGRMVKRLVLRNEDPLRKNSPTARSLIVADERDLEKEQERLTGLIDQFAQGGAGGCTQNPHSFFGNLTPEEWSILMYKHLDHHLRQFGV